MLHSCMRYMAAKGCFWCDLFTTPHANLYLHFVNEMTSYAEGQDSAAIMGDAGLCDD